MQLLSARAYRHKFLMCRDGLNELLLTWMEGRCWCLLVGMVTACLAGCSTVPRDFAPVHPVPVHEVSHHVLGAVLQAHVSDGVVDYPAIAADARFSNYLEMLDRVNPRALPTRHHQLAFWINAYNALAIQGILNGYSPASLWGRYRFFIGQRHAIGGRQLNLYDLEQKLLIPEFQEPRIHFAIVCASRSCPRLSSAPFSASGLEQELDAAARRFVNDPARNGFDRDNKVAYLSMIFNWFEEDFVAEAGSLLGYVARYVDDPELARELTVASYRIEFLPYDWSLNGVSPHGRNHAGS